MKKLLLTLLLLTTSLTTFSSERTFSLAGKYIYNGDGKSEDNGPDTIFFPSDLRNDTDTGYQNYEQPPEAWYAKIPKNTDIVIKDLGKLLEITHTALYGAYVPANVKGVITSPVDLKPFGKEKIEIDNKAKTITFSRKDGNFLAGQRVTTIVKKLANGDIQVNEERKGWAPIPSPFPIYVRGEFILKAK